jgi:chemotaxis protein methyltransferase WspC
MSLDALRQVLEQLYGWSHESLSDTMLRNAIAERAQALNHGKIDHEKAFIAQIIANPQQLRSLSESLTVHETWFFRGVEQLQNAAEHLQKTYWQQKSEEQFRPLRALSAPCSTGEEAYSLAILLSMRGITRADVVVEGIDLSSQAIHHAQLAIYGQNSFRENGWNQPSHLNGIAVSGNKWEVTAEIRRMVEFRVGNLLEKTIPDQRYECIFCRNLLIYVTPQKRTEILHQLSKLLTPTGRLYLSAVESSAAKEADLVPLEPNHLQVFGRSDATSRTDRQSLPSFKPIRRHNTARTTAVPPTKSYSAGTANSTSQRNMPVSQPLSGNQFLRQPIALAQPSSSAGHEMVQQTLLKAESAADAGKLEDAERLLATLDRSTQLSAAALFLSGLISQAKGRFEEAQHAWERAVYLDPTHGPSLQRLWLAASSRGDSRLAEQYRRRWLKRRLES